MHAPSVILFHDSPQIGPHWDWLLGDPDRPGAARLATLRLAGLPAFEGPESLACALLPPHRVAYLEFEGEVSGGRGTVRRVWRGSVRRLEVARDRVGAVVGSDAIPGSGSGSGVWTGLVATPRHDAPDPDRFPWVVRLRPADSG
ncbi:MAG: hypothetical protein AAF108_09755 [Planctomycetota bacterium]